MSHKCKDGMRRFVRSGSYRIRVQHAVTNDTIAFTLDDWRLSVHLHL